MKKYIILFFISILFFVFSNNNLSFLNFNNEVKINQNDKIILLDLSGSNTGMTVDTNDDGYADTLYMWGDNSNGQIGNGEVSDPILNPIIITPQGQDDWNGNIIDFSLGSSQSGVTIDTNLDGYADTLYMWGNAINKVDKYNPQIITPTNGDWNGNIIDFDIGYNHLGITIDTNLDGYADTLYMWGNNSNGKIGDGTTYNRSIPTLITPEGQDDWNGNIIDLSVGGSHSGITIDTNYDGYGDTLYMWGQNNYGQLGDGTNNNEYYPTIITPQNQNYWDGNLINLELGSSHSSLAIDVNNDEYADTLYMWGYNSYGQVGNNPSKVNYPTIITPEGQDDWNGNIIDLSLEGTNSSAAIDINNDGFGDILYEWGNNDYGQIGSNLGSKVSNPTIITPEGQDDWNGNIIDISLGGENIGVIIDNNLDGYADTLYMWGYNNYGQFGNGTTESKNHPELITSSYSFLLKNINLNYYEANNIELDIKLDDYQNIINEEPEVILIDQNDIQYQTTFIADKSNVDDDQYYYQIDNIEYANSYNFTQILINNNIFDISLEEINTDYLISGYQISNINEEEAIIDLDTSQNSNNFNIDNYTNDQRKVKVNYTNLDNNNIYYKEFIIDNSYQTTIDNLNAETNYQIDSIQYFYEDGNYKYQIDQEVTQFQTIPATPIIEADSISIINNSITTNSFEYTIEIDNLKENETKDNFTQYDINNGIWLIDENGESYNSSFVDAKLITNGEINGTQNYQLTFLQEDLISGQIYNFSGIGFNDPNGSNPDTINFTTPLQIETLIINKEFVDNSFFIDPNSITTNSFNFQITIDNLIYIENDSENEPIFSNFNQNDKLYLQDDQGNIYDADYILGSSSLIGEGNESGTVKYQFIFNVSDLEANKTYNFTKISFTNNFNNEFLDISGSGEIKTDNNISTKIIIYIIIIILIIIILLAIILLLIDLKMKRRTKEMEEKLNSDFE